MPFWMILCLIPIAAVIILLLFLGFILGKEIVKDFFENFLENHGRKAQGIIIEVEQYTGDGFHQADICFKGKYEFTDHRSKQYQSEFSRYCFEPYDFANSTYSIEDVIKCYGNGAIIDVFYINWFPIIHTERISLRQTKSLT